MPVFRSTTQAQLLARVLGDPHRDFSVADLARHVGTDISTVSRETTRLVKAGILLEERAGRTRLLRANERSRVFDELRSLALKTFGPAQLAAETFLPLDGVAAVVVFGSWAARHAGIPGNDPHDLDVLIIGQPSRIAVNRSADELTSRLDLPVGITIISQPEWDGDALGIVREIKAGPHLFFPTIAEGATS